MLFERIVAKEPIDKGWSGDQKSRAVLDDGTSVLLRIAPFCSKNIYSQPLLFSVTHKLSFVNWG